ncbi:hypothetical protein ACFWIJ_02200 [Streptomyces sp. NPDC127079]|uniref:Uncharacterized protein n=1 Tax=Streptomyces sp. R39 TaxID=3238631 RepID=A0AB39QKZ2_9ACTN
MMQLTMVSLILLALALRVICIAFYVILFPARNVPSPLRKAITATSASLEPNLTKDQREEAHEEYKAKMRRQFDVCLVGGAIATAAWTVLLVAPSEAPHLSGTTKGFLLAGSIILITGPILARYDGYHLTLLVREAAIYLGFTAIALSLCSATIDLGYKGWRIAAFVVAILLVLRDLVDSCQNMKAVKKLQIAPPQPAAPAPAVPALMVMAFTLLGFVAGRWLPRKRGDHQD